jgi:uncharacterized protein
MSQTTAADSAEGLCSTCGMCCDGVLFHAVELQQGDNPRQLSALGLKLRKKKGVEFFLQPCGAHIPKQEQSGCSCTIYSDRPIRCRSFQCKQLRGVLAGEITRERALETISSTRTQVARVNELIGRVAETNPNRGLAHRVANALTPIPGVEFGEDHDLLRSAMRELTDRLGRDFTAEQPVS